MNTDSTAASLLAVTSSVSVFGSLLPPFADVRKSINNPDMIRDVRMGEVAAFTVVTSIGLMASTMTKSPVPAMVAIVSAGTLAVMYEMTLKHNPGKEATENVRMSEL